MAQAQVGIIMGSDSDLPVMQEAADILGEFDIPFEMTIVSAHRTPRRLYEYADSAVDRRKGRSAMERRDRQGRWVGAAGPAT